ncbi:MAG: response regulator [Candidatus Hydrogenedentes bacterium]|nr:response regulator [Candidatus Hydrogenedentota bacterium]
MSDVKNKVFTSGEVAAICGVSPDTVSRWFDLGQIEGYRLGPGGDRRIPYDNLRLFMLNHGIPLERLEEGEKRILVVDDDPYYLDVIPAALAKAGDYKVYVASTGFDAGTQVAEHNPHVVILDIHLSDMDGRMVCERVKTRAETKSSRILAISGYIDDDEARLLTDYGFDDYLKKPFSLADLCSRVEHLLDLPISRIARPKQTHF